MDRAALRARVRKLTGYNMTESIADADIDTLLNEAHLEICALADWPFLYADGTVATVADQATVDLPTSLRSLSALRHDSADDRGLLKQVTLSVLDDQYDDETGTPWVYARQDETTLHVWPIPDGAYTLHYRGWSVPTDFTLDTDTPVFASEFHPAVAYYAGAKLLMQENASSERIEMFQSEVASYLERMRDRYLESHDARLVQMGARATRPPQRWIVP